MRLWETRVHNISSPSGPLAHRVRPSPHQFARKVKIVGAFLLLCILSFFFFFVLPSTACSRTPHKTRHISDSGIVPDAARGHCLQVGEQSERAGRDVRGSAVVW